MAQRNREINALRARSALLYFYASGNRPLEHRFEVVECLHWLGIVGAATRASATPSRARLDKALLVVEAQNGFAALLGHTLDDTGGPT